MKDDWEKLKDLFDAAISLSGQAREAFFRVVKDEHPDLFSGLTQLLEQHEAAGNFLEADKEVVTATPVPDDLVAGRYRVLRQLGRGGMGEVLLAEDLRLDRKVAIKLLTAEYTNDPERLARFSEEARAASALNHPHIVVLYDIGESEAGKFIVMEYVEGQTLRQICAESERVDLDRAIAWTVQIASALALTHSAGIVHRDIKPENVMVRVDGTVKVLDFGVARRNVLDRSHSNKDPSIGPLTGAGQLLGTLRYMSPEQARAKVAVPASDIFSLGVVLYELVTGIHPFAAEAEVSTLDAIISREPVPPSTLNPEIHAWLEQLILAMLSKNSTDRPAADAVARQLETGVHKPLQIPFESRSKPPFVGRITERAVLRQAVADSRVQGGRLICVVGEAGIGKTMLVEAALAEMESTDRQWLVGRGRCSERLAGSEAYLPFLEGLESLLGFDSNPFADRTLKALAPTWYQRVVRQASRVSDEHAVSQERLKREMSVFLQEISKHRPVLLFLDDLHWADDPTVDMLGYIAGQLGSMQLVVLATYRPTEMFLTGNRFSWLKLDLVGRGLCRELNLEYLTAADIEQYLSIIFPRHQFPGDFAELVHARTEGNALFMTALIHYLKDRGVIHQQDSTWKITEALTELEREMPETVRSIVQRKIDQLQEDDRRVLAAASVQGFDFDSASISQALGINPADLEEQLDRLERVHAFVRSVSHQELPNREMTIQYQFVHVLYQNALYGSIQPSRKAQLSLGLAETLLALYADRCSEIASNLAFLFETGRDFSRAAGYCVLAARNALQVLANQEAAALSRRCLELLERLPASADRTEKEIAALMTLGVALTTLKGGYSDPEVEAAYGRALTLCEHMGEAVNLLPALYGLWSVYLMRSNYAKALELGSRMLPIAKNVQDPMLLTMSYNALGYLKPFIGDLVGAKNDLDEMLRWHNREIQEISFARFGAEPKTGGLPALAWVNWALGFPDQARRTINEAWELTKNVKHSVTVGGLKTWSAWLAIELEDFERAKEIAEDALSFGQQHDLVQTIVYAEMTHGAAIARLGEPEKGIEEIRHAIGLQNATGCTLAQTLMLISLTEALAITGDRSQAEEVLAQARAFRDRTNELMRASEVERMAGNLVLMRLSKADLYNVSSEEIQLIEVAAKCFEASMGIARVHHARSFELKTAIDFASLRRKQGMAGEARAILDPVLNTFTEGFDTPLFVRACAVARSV